MFLFQKSDLQAVPIQQGVVLQKKEEPSSKSLNDALLSRLRPYRSSATAATLVALTGGESPMNRKEEGRLQGILGSLGSKSLRTIK